MRRWERWYDRLSYAIPRQGAAVIVESRPEEDHPALTTLLARLEAIAEAMREPEELDAAPGEALRVLLDQVHRATGALQGFEETVLLTAHERGVPLRTLAATLGLSSPQTVANRLQRIRWAERRGYTARAIEEDPALAAGAIRVRIVYRPGDAAIDGPTQTLIGEMTAEELAKVRQIIAGPAAADDVLTIPTQVEPTGPARVRTFRAGRIVSLDPVEADEPAES